MGGGGGGGGGADWRWEGLVICRLRKEASVVGVCGLLGGVRRWVGLWLGGAN